MSASYRNDDDTTSADRPDWSSLTHPLRALANAYSADASVAPDVMIDRAARHGLDLRDERTLHAYLSGRLEALSDAGGENLATILNLLALVPGDVR